MIPTRLYGPARGHGSWPRVTRGLRQGLEAIGALAGYQPTDDLGHELVDTVNVGYDAPLGVYVGPPSAASVMLGRGQHRERLAIIAANSSWLPRGPLRSLELPRQGAPAAITGFVAPSPWARRVLEQHVTAPVYTWLHGVSADFHVLSPPPERTAWTVLHMASTHAERKGTAQLIHAWMVLLRQRLIPHDSVLHLVCDGPREHFVHAIRKASRNNVDHAETIRLDTRLDLDEATAASLYTEYDLVCQPSRAEGFGLVPLEARACGVPVVVTDGTGHEAHVWSRPTSIGALSTEHLDAVASSPPPGVIVVSTGSVGAIDDGPGALAPTFQTSELGIALALAYDTRRELHQDARDAASWVQERWSWRSVCLGFFTAYEKQLS